MTAGGRVAGAVVITAAAFVLDQVSKAWALSYLGAERQIHLGLGASLRLVFNPGVAFGLGGEFGPALTVGIIAIVAALAAWVLVRALKESGTFATFLLAVVLGGAMGNVWDRISGADKGPLSGEVVDFIAIDWFAIFNVADIFTTVGLISFAVVSVACDSKPTRRHPADTPPTT